MNIDLLRRALSEDYQGGGISLVRKGYSEDYQLVIDQILAAYTDADYTAIFDTSANKWKIMLMTEISAPTAESITATGTLTAEQCRGSLLDSVGQVAAATHTLPPAAAGLNFTFTCSTTEDVHFKAGTGDKTYLNGEALDDGDKVSNTAAAVSHNLTFWCFETATGVYDWACATGPGPWIDGGA